MYNHHQTGPTGTILFAPPFRDPANYNYHPLIVTGLDVVGSAMHNRFVAENKPGATMRRGANYSTWWNGGLRTTVYFHNMIGLLTESIGHPTPIEVAFVPDRQIMSADLPYPIEPQKWHFRQSIEYSITANRAVLDVASRNREIFLYNIYKMGKDSIDKGSKDTWTVYPRRLEAVKAEIARARGAADGGDARMVPGGLTRSTVPLAQYESLMKKPDWRDPRGYILSASEGDFLTATKFVNALIKTGVIVHRATAPFSVSGKAYPAGSYVVKTAQAFRPHVLDMFEPQDHPNDFQYPGGPPIPPYDSAGWTLAYQMGVKFDRVLDGIDGPFERLSGLQAPAPGTVTDAAGAVGYVVSHRHNDAFTAANRLLKAGEEVYAVADRSWRSADGTGVLFVPAKPTTAALLRKSATDLGLSFTAVTERPGGVVHKLTRTRIGLGDRYGGSMPSGWVRWLLEQYEFDYELVFPQTLDAGNLRAKYDVLVFPDGGIPEPPPPGGGPAAGGEFGGRQPRAEDIPAEFRGWLGAVTAERTLPQLKRFAEEGGVLVAFGGSATLGHQLGLPIGDHLVEMTPRGERALPRDKFYVPGSVLRVAVDNTHPVAWGMEREVDVMYDNSPVLRLEPAASRAGVRPAAWFASAAPLRSGWAWGQHYLEGGTVAAGAPLGKGSVYLFGPEITFRAQPHGTFKFLFNSLLVGPALVGSTPVRQTVQQ
jgi:hypothetical protein